MVTLFLDRLQTKTEHWRGLIFKPFLQLCERCHISANTITIFRLALAILFPFLIIAHPTLAWTLITISIALDAVDGSIARFTGSDTDRGKFIDVMADELTFALLYFGTLRLLPDLSLPLSATAWIILFLYLMGMVNRNEHTPSDWIIKPKVQYTIYKVLFILLVIGTLAHWWSNTMTIKGLWLLTFLAGCHFLFHYGDFIKRGNKKEVD